jgi:hypothetical protein
VRAAATRLAIITATAGFGLTAACPVAATGTTTHPARSAWFSTSIADQAGSPVTPPVSQPTGVPKGDDPVSYTGGQSGASSAETLLQFALPRTADASKVTAFAVSLTLDTSPTAPQAGAQGAPIVACLPTRDWPAGEAQSSNQQPTVDCSHPIRGVWKGNTVTFALARLAQSWVDDVNLGVALVNDPKNNTQPFQAVFRGGKQIAATLSFTPATKTPASSTPPPTQHPQHPSGGGAAPPPVPPPGGQASVGGSSSTIPSVSTPLTGSTTTHSNDQSSGQAPVVANSNGDTTQPAAAQAAAHSSSLPARGFWVAAGLLLIVLLGAALALDDRHAASPERTGGSRLDRLLRDPARLATFTARSQP